MTDVAVLVLNWNGRRWLEGCLGAVLADGGAGEVWVVDNGSGDGSVELVRERFPEVRVLELGHNFGFGAAYNRAVAACDAEWVVLLNNDTRVQAGWLEALVRQAEGHPEAGAVGACLLGMDRPEVVGHAGGQITVLGSAYDVGLGTTGVGTLTLPSPAAAGEGAREVSCVTGAAMLVRREAFVDAGGFDEAYFAYFEDADLCWRLWLRGWTVRYAPAARVLHAYGGSGASSRLAPFRIEHCQANRLQNMAKNLDAATLGRVLALSAGYDAYRLSGLVRGGHLEAARAHVRGTRRFVGVLPHVLEQRRRVQGRRVRTDGELFRRGVLVGVRDAAREWRRLEGAAVDDPVDSHFRNV